MRDRERGQVLPLALVAIGLAAVVAAGAVRLGAAVHQRAGAQAAADAAALAGVAEGEPGARRLAEANGATLVSYEEDPPAVTVVVRRRGVEATARAEWREGPRMRASGRLPVD